MSKFTFQVQETYSFEVEVDADNEDEAEKLLIEHLTEEDDCAADERVEMTVFPELTYSFNPRITFH